MKTMRLADIKIKESFLNSIPKEEKMIECRNNWNKYHSQDRYLVIDHNNCLIDGYIQYLVLKENGINEAEIKISNRRKRCWYRKNIKGWNVPCYRSENTTYVYGTHANGYTNNKEYLWRVPKSWNWFYENVQVGDAIYCNTKYGVKPVIVSSVVVSDKCPVDMRVKKVASKTIKRNREVVEGK